MLDASLRFSRRPVESSVVPEFPVLPSSAKHMATRTICAYIQQQIAIQPCRFCGASLQRTFADLGMSPLCETYPSASDLNRGEVYYPLHVYVCEQCFLVQLGEY